MRLGMACVLALAAALAAPGASALGDERGPGGGGTHHAKFWRRDKVRHQLRLTDDEIDKLEDILARNRQRLEDMKADVKKKHATLDALLTDDRTDEATILGQVDLIEHARAKLGKARVTMLLDCRVALTPHLRLPLSQLPRMDTPQAGSDTASSD